MILRATMLFTAGLILTAAVCRFTVRDVAFVDLGDSNYRCFTFVSDTDSPGVAAAARETAKSAFAETNVEFAIVDLDDEHHAARSFARNLDIKSFPTTVLVSPDDEAIEVPFGGSFATVGAKVFESIANSKLRTRITEEVIRRYCVVLLVESDDQKRNAAAAKAVKTALAGIEKVFAKMPKDVGQLPEMIAVQRAEQTAERILLWSLGIRAPGPEPVVTLLTGRGRQFGANLSGEGISESTVLDILAKAGQSCECGLDRSWMRGARVPLRWDADTRQLAADVLGFDPENPLVRAEVSSILAKDASGIGKGAPTVADMLLGYAEADGLPDQMDETTDGASGLPNPEPTRARASARATDEGTDSSGLAMWMTLCGLLVASVAVAGFVLLRVRRS